MRRIILLAAAAAAAPFAAAPATAQTAGAFMNNPRFQDPPPVRCVSTVEMQHCAAHDLRVADAAMTARYQAARDRSSPAGRQRLLAEQRRWLQARDRDCLARGNGGGTMASLAVAQCWIATTKERTRALAADGNGASTRPPASAARFVGRWRGGEGTYVNITRAGTDYRLDMQWDLDNSGRFVATPGGGGLRFRRNGVVETLRASDGDATGLSALRGKTDCLIVRRSEGYCRY